MDVLNGGYTILRRQNVYVMVGTHSAELENDSIKVTSGFGFNTEVVKNGWYRRLLPEHRPGGDHNRWLWASKR